MKREPSSISTSCPDLITECLRTQELTSPSITEYRPASQDSLHHHLSTAGNILNFSPQHEPQGYDWHVVQRSKPAYCQIINIENSSFVNCNCIASHQRFVSFSCLYFLYVCECRGPIIAILCQPNTIQTPSASKILPLTRVEKAGSIESLPLKGSMPEILLWVLSTNNYIVIYYIYFTTNLSF